MVADREISYGGCIHEAFTLNGFIAFIRLGINLIQAYLYLCRTLFYLNHSKIIKDLGR